MTWIYTPIAWGKLESADSIITRMHHAAGLYMNLIESYKAKLYVKSELDIIKRNKGFRYIPGLFRIKNNENRFIVETVSDLHYTAPRIYDQRIVAYTGTLSRPQEIPGITEYFNMNVYAPYIMGETLLSPLAPNSNRYYQYIVDSVSTDSASRLQYHIRFIPKNKSYQLIDGQMTITEGAWSVREMQFKGRSDMLTFSCHLKMGAVGAPTEHLPIQNDIDASFGFMYNVLEGYYEAMIRYDSITFKPQEETYEKKIGSLNLTSSFTLQCNDSTYTNNYALLDSIRPRPLTESEKSIYSKYQAKFDTLGLTKPRKQKSANTHSRQMWGNVGDFFLTDTKWKLSESATLRNSPFLNPLMFSYGATNGLAYRQDLRLSSQFKDGQWLYARGRIGYNFKYNEFYWSTTGEYMYRPEKQAILRFQIGNGNRISTSKIIEKLKNMSSDSIDFSRLNIERFQDFNFKLSHSMEVTNGLTLDVGLVYHRRTPAAPPENSFREVELPPNVQEGLQANIRPKYITVAPQVRLQYTPLQYYYMNGRQKVNLSSPLPTFIFEYERGLRNVFHSTGIYERWELDMQHRIRTGLLSRLYYRLGAGMFTNLQETYFVDFENFRRNNLPEGWNDEIGGVFQALNGTWYNASPYYVRGHITYEAPFLVLRHLLKYTNHVRHERLYLNALTMKKLGPYFEVGYGIGTFVFDMGIFLSLEKFKNIGFGYKFTIELFGK